MNCLSAPVFVTRQLSHTLASWTTATMSTGRPSLAQTTEGNTAFLVFTKRKRKKERKIPRMHDFPPHRHGSGPLPCGSGPFRGMWSRLSENKFCPEIAGDLPSYPRMKCMNLDGESRLMLRGLARVHGLQTLSANLSRSVRFHRQRRNFRRWTAR
jgi:hypothetical protein